MKQGDMFAQIGSIIASLMFIWAIFQQFFPYQLRNQIEKYSQKLVTFIYPYIQITFHEFTGERLMRSEAYSSIENYLSTKASTQAKRLKGDIAKNNQALVLSMDDHEEVGDEFNGVKLWWASGKNISKPNSFSLHHNIDEKRYYKLTFHKHNRDVILGTYLNYVLKEGKAIKVKNRQRKLYTNSGSYWSHVVFEHPSTFETLAMDFEKKKMIIDDLITFSKAGEFYARIGRAWKRGYLLYGPPGTGKSTMIAAMANLLGYDLYDLELTAVKDNTELRKLLIETSSKSIIVIEDIDCSLDLTGQRRKKKEKRELEDEEKDSREKKGGIMEERDGKTSNVTLSGLLNFIDGLWSACGGERLIVFTTNYVEKLDPALVRKGRMDKHIELSYCGFEAFKMLAKNYLNIESHNLFGTICELLKEVEITPADVAEHLMPKTASGDAEIYLKSLIQALELAKEEARVKSVEDSKKL
ncbi:putative ATPase, AAA-type, core, AAA-type ATPase domain-containing protein [Medicago truncatula]|uniref:P-loop nucleoside triphosphate hydrolase superfamily protein n=1 Tax=Medicago truncatula TaxID=3880 RepID=A0A072VFB1_MEDTR|nr:AAA-ATPase ASD, mitochondrial [Medicago truncatula]KEH40138.1 P-loop nucleoside triphosphate hydrolase superfamily protein [Medicago truncatula]RHN77466.1 putative ATPase, AAA-type, core, AAA-type ATPase domain-containing protein [Medicago truncatula]